MPRTRSLAWSELKIGILSTAAIVAAAMLAFAVGGEGGFFWQRYPLKTRFDNVATVRAGTPVRVSGIEVGKVTDVVLSGGAVEVWLEVSKDVRPLITDRSMAAIGSISMLGEGAIDITAGPGGTAVPDWGYVRSGVAPGSIAALTESANAGLASANLLVADLRAGKGTLGKLIVDESAYRELDALLASAGRVARAVETGRGSAGRLINDRRLYDELAAATANLNGITERVRAGEGSLGVLLNDPAMAKSLAAASARLDGITERLERGEGTVGKLLTDDALHARLTSLTARLDDLSSHLQSGRGTAGRLLHDDMLYENMSASVAELRQLISDIRKDPKKYLNVKVSLF